MLEFDTNNKFIQDVFEEYCYWMVEKSSELGQWRATAKLMANHLCSFFNNQIPTCFSDFNINAFNNICNFIKLNPTSEFVRPHKRTQFIGFGWSTFFYFLFDRHSQNISLGIEDGVSREFVISRNCVELYNNGYRFYYLNSNDPVPDSDKIVTVPNGLENTNPSDKVNQLWSFDFSYIKDKVLKELVKRWFWSGMNAAKPKSMMSQSIGCANLRRFLQFRQEFRENKLKDVLKDNPKDFEIDNAFIIEDVFFYMNYLENNEHTYETIKEKFKPLRSFFKWLRSNNLYQVEESIFAYIVIRRDRPIEKDESKEAIPDDHLNLLLSTLASKAKENLNFELYYYIFLLSVSTPLRLSEILDLKIDSIIQIPSFYKSCLDRIRKITEPIRNQAPSEVRPYLFLVNNVVGLFSTIKQETYSFYLSKVCSSLGFPNYGPRRARKTYMTTIVNKAIAEGVSLLDLAALTKHASPNTTLNHYVDIRLRDQLEAMNGVIIGNIEPKGDIVYTANFGTDSLVAMGKGYCRHEQCNVTGLTDCLMCPNKGFVTTPAFIPNFEAAIEDVNNRMLAAGSEHDREHLYAFKTLLVAYIEKMILISNSRNTDHAKD